MDYHQNARTMVRSREQMARMVMEEGATLKAAAARFEVSAKTAAKWVRRYRHGGRAGLCDLSSRPHCSPRQTPSTLLEKVLALRRLRYNGWRIARELNLSRATVSRILRRAGLNRLPSACTSLPISGNSRSSYFSHAILCKLSNANYGQIRLFDPHPSMIFANLQIQFSHTPASI